MAVSLRALSFNIHHGARLWGGSAFPELVDCLRESGADIIGLQEADVRRLRSRFRRQPRALAAALGYHSYFGASIGGDRWRGYGNALLSRFPITDPAKITLPSPAGEPRSCLAARVQVGGLSLHCLVTHLSPQRDAREEQLPLLAAFSRSVPSPKLLLGDLNTTPGDPLLRDLREEYQAHSTAPTFPAHAPTNKIDYVLFSREFRALGGGIISTGVSDHLPVWVDLELDVGLD